MIKKQTTKEVKVVGNEVVVQNNRLIDASRTLTLQQQKLFSFFISKLNPNNPEEIMFRISVNEFAKAVGIKDSSIDNAYRDLRKVIKRFMATVISIVNTTEATVTDVPIITYAKYWTKHGCADVRLAPELAPYLFNLQKEFTQYKLSQIINLSSLYAIRLYELLKKNEMIGHRTFLLEDLRKKLRISDNKLKTFKDFKKWVLEIAQREINEKTDLIIDIDYQKTGRKITVIEFNIISKDQNTEDNKFVYAPSQIQYRKNINEVMEFGATKSQAKDILEFANSPRDIEEAISAVQEQIDNGNVNNPTAMLKTAIKEKWRVNKKQSITKVKPSENSKLKTRESSKKFSKLFEYILKKIT